MRVLKLGVKWLAIGSWQQLIEKITEADTLKTTGDVAQELEIDHSMVVIWYLKQLERWKGSISGCLMSWPQIKKKKNHRFSVSSSLIAGNNNEPFLDRIVIYDEGWILYDNWRQLAQWLDHEAPKHFPKSSLHQIKVMVTVWWSAPFWSTTAFWIPMKPSHLRSTFSKLTRCTKTCNTCSRYWSTESQPDPFPWQRLILHCPANASKVERIALRNFASSIFTLPLADY